MIHRVFSSTLDSFKTVDFHSGLNLLVAEKTQNASDHQTRNCAGKSSLIEIIHFALGGDAKSNSIFRTEALAEHGFGMTFDLGGARTIVERFGIRHGEIAIHDADAAAWPVAPTPGKPGAPATLKCDQWKTVLGSIAYGLQSDWPAYSPTFRLIFEYFARRRGGGPKRQDDGFLNPGSYSIFMQPWQQQVALSWLLGLDWQIPREFEDVHLKEKSLKILRKELKSGIFESVVGSAAQLRSRLTLVEQRAQKLEREVSAFQVLPEYHELEREASTLAVRIAEASNENTLDQESLDYLRQAVTAEQPPSPDEVLRVYDEAGIVLANGAVKRLDEVRRFHEAVIQNRAAHLQADIERLTGSIERRQRQARQWESRRQEILSILSVHGALEQYTKIQGELTRLRAELEELRRHQEIATKLETSQTDLTIERAQLQKRLQIDHQERVSQINEAVLLFEQFSQSLCEHEGTLAINATDRGPEFQIQVEGDRGKGIQQMQIFCFDLMLSVLMARRKLGLGFLIHDSHLFDGMDSRQIGRALQIGADTAEKYGFQYLVTLNSDTLELPDVRRSFDPTPFILPVSLTDAIETGGLFGFRFD